MSRTLIRSCLISSVVWGYSVVGFAQPSSDDAAPAVTEGAPATEAAREMEQTARPESSRSARFLGIAPGESTLSEVKEKLGEPRSEQASADGIVLEYQLGPFPKVDVSLAGDLVVSILAHLSETRDPKELAAELNLATFVPVTVKRDDEVLGIAYPERGVLFSYAANSPRPRVAHVLLEPLSAEMFLLRLGATPRDQYTQRLADLERVLDFEPQNAEALWLGSRLLAVIGKTDGALTLATQAAQLSPENDRFQLTRAKFTARAGDHQGSVATVKRLLQRPGTAPIDRARAELEFGELMASGLKRDYKVAVEHHLAAVKSATPLVSTRDTTIRHEAELVLVDAYLGAANAIARGNWDRKHEVVPKWLRSAEELASRFVQNDGADPMLPLLVWRRTLEAYAAMDDEVVDTLAVAEAARQVGEKLIEDSTDPLYKQHVRWELLQAKFAALRVEQARGRYSQALKYAEQAISSVEQLPEEAVANAHTRYLIGRLYYYVGAIHAIHHKDHAEAIRWYERAIPHFEGGLPKSELYDTGIHGERFVSMGVSYWESELSDEALSLTERGLDLMERAARAGLLVSRSLVVPYTNLAEIHRASGRSDEAEEFEAKVARLEGERSRR